MGVTAPVSALDDWIPIRVRDGDEPQVEWCWTDGLAFDEPSYAQTVERALSRPFGLLFRQETPIGTLDRLEPGLEPSGFILHASRCGSTLVARMLAAVPQHLVVAEPMPVDQVLRAGAPVADRVRWLRGIVSALGRRRRGDERAYVLKLDAWSVCSFDIVRLAYPDVPWVFLVRDPVEVLVSHLRGRGAHMVPGAIDPRLFGLDEEQILQMPPEEYCARVLAAIYRSALDHHDERSLVLDYSRLPDAVVESIFPAFGLECDEPDLERMRAVTRFDAKNPRLFHSPDSEAKQDEASPALRRAAEQWVRPLYEELLAC
jgi:hypothetical protein